MTDASPGRPGAEPRREDVPPAGAVVWHPATAAAYVESADRVVVLDLDRLDLPPYVFEGPAAEIWSRLDGIRSEDEIVADLAGEYNASREVVAGDVRRFVERLRRLGLVVDAPVGRGGD